MPYKVPEFILVCNIYTGGGTIADRTRWWLSKTLRLQSPCNLGQGRRIQPHLQVADINESQVMGTPQLLLPPFTDIRDASCNGISDIVEVPAGSQRWYSVITVDDIGKGFPNEHRYAFLFKIYEAPNPEILAGSNWPTPIP